MPQWSEKVPKENLSETVSSTRYIFTSFRIQINNFQKSSKKFIIDLLAKNVPLNLSGAIFFVGLGYSLKWWYKDQLFVVLLKQNLPALSESQQNISWKTGESILNGDFSYPEGGKASIESKALESIALQTIDAFPPSGHEKSWTPLIERIDLYANHIRVKFKEPWQKHVYERFIGVFGEPSQVKVCKQMLTTKHKDWWKENASLSSKASLLGGKNYLPNQQKKNTVDITLAKRRTQRSTAPLEDQTNPILAHRSETSEGKGVFTQYQRSVGGFILVEGYGEAPHLDMRTWKEPESAKTEELTNVKNFSIYTPEKSIFPKKWFKLSPRNLCSLLAQREKGLTSLNQKEGHTLLKGSEAKFRTEASQPYPFTPSQLGNVSLGSPEGVKGHGVKGSRLPSAASAKMNSQSLPATQAPLPHTNQPLPNTPKGERGMGTRLRTEGACVAFPLRGTDMGYRKFSFASKASKGIGMGRFFPFQGILSPCDSLLNLERDSESKKEIIDIVDGMNFYKGDFLKHESVNSAILQTTFAKLRVFLSNREALQRPLYFARGSSETEGPKLSIIEETFTDELSYPLQLTKKLTGWQPSSNLLLLNTYLDEIPYKLENALQPYLPKKDLHLLFSSTAFRKSSNGSASDPSTSFSKVSDCQTLQGKALPHKVAKWYLEGVRGGLLYESSWTPTLRYSSANGKTSETEAQRKLDLLKEITHFVPTNVIERKFLVSTKESETYLKKLHLFETKKLLQNQLAALINSIDSTDKSFVKPYLVDVTKKVLEVAKRRTNTQKGVILPPASYLLPNRSEVAKRRLSEASNLILAQRSETSGGKEVYPFAMQSFQGLRSFTPKGYSQAQYVDLSTKSIGSKEEAYKIEGYWGTEVDRLTQLFAYSTVANAADVVKIEGLDPLLLLNTLGFTFNNFSPLTNPPILLSYDKLGEVPNVLDSKDICKPERAPLRDLANSFGHKRGSEASEVVKRLTPKASETLPSSSFATLLPKERISSVGNSALLTKESESEALQIENLYRSISFYFNPKNLNWGVSQQSTNGKFNLLLKEINKEITSNDGLSHEVPDFVMPRRGPLQIHFSEGEAKPSYTSPEGSLPRRGTALLALHSKEPMTTQLTHLIFEFLNGKGGLSYVYPPDAALVAKQHTSKPLPLGGTEALQSADLVTESTYCNSNKGAQPSPSRQPASGANVERRQSVQVAKLYPVPLWSKEIKEKPEGVKGLAQLEVQLHQKINIVDKDIYFDKNLRYMSGYVYPDIQSDPLKAHLYQWLGKNKNLLPWFSSHYLNDQPIAHDPLTPSYVSPFTPRNAKGYGGTIYVEKSQERLDTLPHKKVKAKKPNNSFFRFNNRMVNLLDKACLFGREISIKRITPTIFESLHRSSAPTLRYFVRINSQRNAEPERVQLPLGAFGVMGAFTPNQLQRFTKAKPLTSSLLAQRGKSTASLPKEVEVLTPRPYKDYAKCDSTVYPYEISPSFIVSKNHSLGNIEFPYKKFNHYLAKFPGFSDPNQFFTILPQISCGNENLVNESPERSTLSESPAGPSGPLDVVKDRSKEGVVKLPREEFGIFDSKRKAEKMSSSKAIPRRGAANKEINKVFIQKNGCNSRKVAYSGIVVQRDKWTKDFQPFNESKKLLDGASKSSIWGTLFLGPENPVTDRQCHFFGQKQLSTLDTNSLQRDYLRHLGREILTQSNLKGYTELSKFSSIERTKILSLSKKVNSFFFKKRKYSYLLEPKDQWHLLFQEQLCTALEDCKKYPLSAVRSFEETHVEKLNPEAALSGQIKVSAPLIMARFPKKLVQSNPYPFTPSGYGVKLGKPPSGYGVWGKGVNAHSKPLPLATQRGVGTRLSTVHNKLMSHQLEQDISWRPFCHLQRSSISNYKPNLEDLDYYHISFTSPVFTQSSAMQAQYFFPNVSLPQNETLVRSKGFASLGVTKIETETKLSELEGPKGDSTTSVETSDIPLEKTDNITVPLVSMSPYLSYLYHTHTPKGESYVSPSATQAPHPFTPSGYGVKGYGVEQKTLQILSHYPLFTERFSEEANAVPCLNKNSFLYLPGEIVPLRSKASESTTHTPKGERLTSEGSTKNLSNNLLGIQNMCTSLLIQEPFSPSGSWAVLNQWIFLIALLFWVEQTLLNNVFPALFALEQILLSAAGLKSGGPEGDRTHVLRISKNETPKFQNLAGIDGLLGELSELVLFLRGQRNLGIAKLSFWNKCSVKMNMQSKNSYGVLLTGSPGTGKTFLVRALANEAKVPVLILSASTLTASKLNNNKPSSSIRHAFKRAKQLAPCILFIDEIDALGKSRGKIVTDINEIVADTNSTASASLNASFLPHKRTPSEFILAGGSISNSSASGSMFSYEQFGQNCSNFSATLLNKWEYPLQSTILQESNEINQNSLCQEKLVDLLKISGGTQGMQDYHRKTSIKGAFIPKIPSAEELKNSSRSDTLQKEKTNTYSKEVQQLPTSEKDMTRGKFGPLTQLLVSMDGVSSFSGVLIMGATNRPELLDPALTRPGRFEKIIRIDKPSEQNRIEILQLYSQNLGVQKQIPWSYLATRTIGLTTADLAVAMNYSSLRAIIQDSVHTLETIEYGLNCITRL